MNKHPLDIVNERLETGYYNELLPYSYSKDAATICYLLGYCSKTTLDNIKSLYEWYSIKQ